MRTILLFASLVTIVACATSPGDVAPDLVGPWLGQAPPGSTPKLFAPGLVSTRHHEHSGAVFSPDGDEVFWTVRQALAKLVPRPMRQRA